MPLVAVSHAYDAQPFGDGGVGLQQRQGQVPTQVHGPAKDHVATGIGLSDETTTAKYFHSPADSGVGVAGTGDGDVAMGL